MHQRILLTKFGQNWTFGYGARGRMPEERRKKERKKKRDKYRTLVVSTKVKKEETGQIQDLSRFD